MSQWIIGEKSSSLPLTQENLNRLGLVANINGGGRFGVRRPDAVVAADVALQRAADEPTLAARLISAPFEEYGLIGVGIL